MQKPNRKTRGPHNSGYQAHSQARLNASLCCKVGALRIEFEWQRDTSTTPTTEPSSRSPLQLCLHACALLATWLLHASGPITRIMNHARWLGKP
jgi:hypothetical protein